MACKARRRARLRGPKRSRLLIILQMIFKHSHGLYHFDDRHGRIIALVALTYLNVPFVVTIAVNMISSGIPAPGETSSHCRDAWFPATLNAFAHPWIQAALR